MDGGARLGELTYKPNRILRGPATLEVLLRLRRSHANHATLVVIER